ncbi:hypothetical protein N8H69_21840 [Achromobacter spanius]|uniref:hypothetical protein n=1 Tax=Achromobacter spanius TaxID=217203 RepID=UPI0022277D7B|nr:hypothetical protein [Achromobacter spanius]MCW3155198.1 hypothetical protein [Achromobacter spanius]
MLGSRKIGARGRMASETAFASVQFMPATPSATIAKLSILHSNFGNLGYAAALWADTADGQTGGAEMQSAPEGARHLLAVLGGHDGKAGSVVKEKVVGVHSNSAWARPCFTWLSRPLGYESSSACIGSFRAAFGMAPTR